MSELRAASPARVLCKMPLRLLFCTPPLSEGALPSAAIGPAQITLSVSPTGEVAQVLKGTKNDSSHLHLPPELRILPGGAGRFQSNILLRLM